MDHREESMEPFEPRKSIFYKAHIKKMTGVGTQSTTSTIFAHTSKGLAEEINRHMGLHVYGSGIVTSSIIRNTIYYPERVSPKWGFLKVERVDLRVASGEKKYDSLIINGDDAQCNKKAESEEEAEGVARNAEGDEGN